MNKKTIIIVSIAVVLSVVYFCTGFFVVQPIGALPEGGTIWYVRSGTKMPFISSADGLSLQRTGEVSLLSRGVILGTVAKEIGDKKIMTLPYMDFMYSISTGGRKFEK